MFKYSWEQIKRDEIYREGMELNSEYKKGGGLASGCRWISQEAREFPALDQIKNYAEENENILASDNWINHTEGEEE